MPMLYNAANALLSEIFLFWFTSVCELRLTSYAPKHASLSLSNSPIMRISSKLEKHKVPASLYAPNNPSTIEDALFYVSSGNAVATYKLQPVRTSLSCFCCVSTNDNKT